MKKIAIISVMALLLTGCGASKTNPPTPSASPTTAAYKVPTTCELPDVNAAFALIIPPSKYIPTKWTPAPGTDLEAALQSGGIACSYGDQEGEVGGTVIWAENTGGLWDSRVKTWLQDGMVKVDIPGINESAAYKLPDGATAADGLPAWKINMLVGNIWIQLGAGFIQGWKEATPILKAAIKAAN